MPSTAWIAIAAVVGILAAYWFIDEYRDADEASEAVAGAAERAGEATEKAARGTRYAVVGFAGIGASLAMEILQLGADLNAILGGVPVIIGHILFGGLTLAGLQGVIPFDREIAGFAFIFITVIALILRYGGDD